MPNMLVHNESDRTVQAHLHRLSRIVQQGGEDESAKAARAELPGFISAVNACLERHSPDSNGNCVSCTKGPWWRRRRVPCRMLIAIHAAMFEIDTAQHRHSLAETGR
ncbi:hypothetical protein F0L68_23430 [Solihabitans fulvus]|uniref:Uncharacterized protein n=1 Tax=Solihabitans fulvus TaxID=1892852 RepID=A0A5B2X7C0_9PSEU|nr:hypothetical protein [Solihabitans fulvus]KAA2258782.1 hypothetical protein F0L68_23430 [Solihabitans fulvus]